MASHLTLRILAAVLALACAAPAAAAGKPQRVMSINGCADQLVLMLLPRARIASVTYLAVTGATPPDIAARARGLRLNHGVAEEVLAEKPDLIVAGDFTTPVARRLAKRVGLPLIELKTATSFADIEDNLRRLGAAVGEPARAQALIDAMEAKLAVLTRTAPQRRIVAVGWDGTGQVEGKGSLFDAILIAAGADDEAALPGLASRSLDLEQLLALQPQPDVLLVGASRAVTAGAEADQVRHPVLTRRYGSRRVAYPEAAFACGSPASVDAAAALRKAMLDAMAPAGRRP